MRARFELIAAAALLIAGCDADALYAYCNTNVECGTRRYNDDDSTYEVPLQCIEVSVELSPEQTTRGNFCTIGCASSHDCDSRSGFPRGRCIQWTDDDEAFCYAPCETDADCYPSSSCEEVRSEGELVSVCLPQRA